MWREQTGSPVKFTGRHSIQSELSSVSGFVPRNGVETPKGHRPLQAKRLALEPAEKMIFLFEDRFLESVTKIMTPDDESYSVEPRIKSGSG